MPALVMPDLNHQWCRSRGAKRSSPPTQVLRGERGSEGKVNAESFGMAIGSPAFKARNGSAESKGAGMGARAR